MAKKPRNSARNERFESVSAAALRCGSRTRAMSGAVMSVLMTMPMMAPCQPMRSYTSSSTPPPSSIPSMNPAESQPFARARSDSSSSSMASPSMAMSRKEAMMLAATMRPKMG
jgi:hypothetical protein